jgi:hypothetical protein
MPLIDELNGQASLTHDQVRKIVGAPFIMWSTGSIQNLFGQAKRGATSDFTEPQSDQESLLMLKGPENGRIDSLAGNLDIAAAYLVVDKLLAQVEDNHPELTFYKQLREMTQVTGPAAQRIVGDVEQRVSKAQAVYDNGNIKVFQMSLAIGGYRANNRDMGWANLNRQQQKFLPFNLDSYQAGNLDMSIMPRPLLTPTKLEQAQENQALWLGVQAAAKAGVPLPLVLKSEGWTPQELAELEQAQQKEDAKQQAQFEQQQATMQKFSTPVDNSNPQNQKKQVAGQKG